MRTVLGIDAGGTKTVGLLADETGQVLRETRAGGANLRLHGELGVEKVLYQVIDTLGALELQDDLGPVAAVGLGIAGIGLDGSEDRELLHGVLRRLGIRRPIAIVHDAVVALVAGAPEGVGVVLVSGTGSIAYGADPAGNSTRAGGWGYLLGDEGSAFWLGHAAVRRGIRAADGRGPATLLYDLICDKVGVAEPSGLVEWFYDQELSRHRVATLASLVEEAAGQGDRAAEELLDQAAHYLARAAEAVAHRLEFPGTYPLVVSGGTFRACPSLFGRLEKTLELPRVEVRRLTVEPAHGAVTLALKLLPSS